MIAILIIITLVWMFWTVSVSRQDKPVISCYMVGLILMAIWCTYIERMG